MRRVNNLCLRHIDRNDDFPNLFTWNITGQRNDGVVLDRYEPKLNAVLRKSYLVPFHEP